MSRKLTVETLSQRKNTNILKPQISEIIKTIEPKIIEADKLGSSSYTFELPTIFNAPNVGAESAQLIVYSEIITEFESRGFEVLFSLTNTPHITFRWPADIHKDEIKRMKDIIRKHSITLAQNQ